MNKEDQIKIALKIAYDLCDDKSIEYTIQFMIDNIIDLVSFDKAHDIVIDFIEKN